MWKDLFREENYIPASWGIFHGAFGRKKVLHFRTPQDLFQENLAKCCTWFDNSSKFTPSIKSPPFTAGYKIGFVDFRLSYRSFRDSDHGGTDILEYHLDFGGHSFYGS